MKPNEKEKAESPEVLDAATVAAIKEGIESEEQGNFVTLDEAVKFAKERRKKWMKSNQSA
ncbi:MAG: hypothetical protein KF784_12040 [Fimbriimonadaceae bacterium]|nr:hypothetical protein [Fimbriimonadaceae bacterium]